MAVELLVLVAPMISAPGEAPAGYWTDTRYPALSRPHELADRLEAYAAGQGLLGDD